MEECTAPTGRQRTGLLCRSLGGSRARCRRGRAQRERKGYDINAGGHGVGVVLVIIAILVVVPGIVLNCVDEPGRLQVHSKNPTPYGYTISLLLFFLPVAALGWWFLRHPEHRLAHQAYWKTVLVLVPFGFLLDLVFGNFFFQFPNHEATLGIGIPSPGGPIPLEEFLFYVGGFLAVLLCYIWADECWLSCYKVAEHEAALKSRSPLVQLHLVSVVLGTTLWAAAVLYKRHWAAEPGGFPWYFSYLVLVTVIPSAAFFRTARPLINWRAFSFTLLFILLVSVIWEVTLAVPYGWWGYQPEAMMGLRIRAWSDLPVEAVGVWLVVTWDTAIVYEVIKLLHRRRLSTNSVISETSWGDGKALRENVADTFYRTRFNVCIAEQSSAATDDPNLTENQGSHSSNGSAFGEPAEVKPRAKVLPKPGTSFRGNRRGTIFP